jgi:prepilin-type N-terminal cleavage/methylation domain-containing protein
MKLDANHRLRAFTLVELLVVITVIAILAALLLPALGKAKQRAQTASCLNNLKQLQLSFRLYVDENNDFLPPNEAIPNLDTSWVLGNAQTDVTTTNLQNGLIFRYNQSVKIYVCPASTLLISDGNGGSVPQTRTYSVDFALGSYAPPSLAAGGLAQGGGTFNGVTTLAKFSQIQAGSAGVAQKLCLWTRPKTTSTMAVLEFIPKARETTPGGRCRVAGTTAKDLARSPLPTATPRFGAGTAARSLPIIRSLTPRSGTSMHSPTRRAAPVARMICPVSRRVRCTEIPKDAKFGTTKLPIGQYQSSRLYEEKFDYPRGCDGRNPGLF